MSPPLKTLKRNHPAASESKQHPQFSRASSKMMTRVVETTKTGFQIKQSRQDCTLITLLNMKPNPTKFKVNKFCLIWLMSNRDRSTKKLKASLTTKNTTCCPKILRLYLLLISNLPQFPVTVFLFNFAQNNGTRLMAN